MLNDSFSPLHRSAEQLRVALLALTAAALCLITVASAGDAPTVKFRAGAATSNITPELGIDIVGGFLPFPATHIHDELHARCLVLDDGKTMMALVVCDLLALHRCVSIEARKLIEDATGIPAANVLISATHTHSAGNAIGAPPRGFYSDHELTDYQRFVARRIADGVRRAVNLLRPAEIAFGTVDVPEHVFNRRWFMKPGTVPVTPFGGTTDKVKMNPGPGDPNLVEPAGPTDPIISFIALREPAGRLISVFSAYSLHYVGGVGLTEGHVLFGDTKEGTMALRLCPSLSMNSSKNFVNTGNSTGHAVNSNGDRDKDIWGKHANWVCYHGPDPKGNAISVVIFSHPSNLRSPTTWHARDYGLFAVNPFGLHDFEPDKPAGAGDYTIKKGDSLALRYRFYFAKGQADAAKLDAAFAVFAKTK